MTKEVLDKKQVLNDLKKWSDSLYNASVLLAAINADFQELHNQLNKKEE